MKENPETPPVFKTWNRWYAIVIGFLVFQAIVYYILTQYFK